MGKPTVSKSVAMSRVYFQIEKSVHFITAHIHNTVLRNSPIRVVCELYMME